MSRQSYFLLSKVNYFKNLEVEFWITRTNKSKEYWCTVCINVKAEGIRRDKWSGVQID